MAKKSGLMNFDVASLKAMLLNIGFSEEDFEDQRMRAKPVQCFSLFSMKSIKVEIYPSEFYIGYCASSQNLDKIAEVLINAGYEISRRSFIKVKHSKVQNEVYAEFVKIVSLIDSISNFKTRSHNVAMFPAERYENVFGKIAMSVQHAHLIKDQLSLDKPRELLKADAIDKIIVKYASKKWSPSWEPNKFWREHVVPCCMIMNRVNEMVKEGATTKSIAAFIEKHMVIALISVEEQQRLDVDLGLQTTMPEGWKWGDDIFARLHAAGIEFAQI